MSACRSACHRKRVRRVGEDPREDVRVGVGVGAVLFQLYNGAVCVCERRLRHFEQPLASDMNT